MLAVRTEKVIQRDLWVAVPAFAALFALLFQYRILSLLRRMGFAVAPIGTKLPLELEFQGASQWLLPISYTLDYLNTIWFTTLLGILIAGALVSLTPRLVRRSLAGNGLRQHLAGLLFGVPNMLCTCCAVSTTVGLRKAGAGLISSLSFFVAAPALNIVVILLAFQLLPLKLAIARTVLGLVAASAVTYAAARFTPGLEVEGPPAGQERQGLASVPELLGSWLSNTWDIARNVVPVLVVGFLLVGVLKALLPFETVARYLGEGPWPTLLASAVGTVLMVPTFTEVLWVQEFTTQGMGTGPAVALLTTLPTVSFPSLWVLGRALGSYRLAASLGIGVLLLGLVGGMVLALA